MAQVYTVKLAACRVRCSSSATRTTLRGRCAHGSPCGFSSSKCRQPFLFGAFGAADAMYAPVVLRFRTYEVELPPACRAYADAVLALPAMREWIEAAQRETEVIPQFDMAE